MKRWRWGQSVARGFRILLFLLLGSLLSGCGSTNSAPSNPPPPPPVPLTAGDVQQVVQNAAQSLNVPMVVAVADRAGKILAVFQNAGAPVTAPGNFGVPVDSKELAVALARTAALFSNNQAPLSSRTVRFISGIHFPPGIENAANGDLYGIENTNRGCPLNAAFLPGKNIDPSRSIDGLSLGLGISTGKADTVDSDPTAVNPGGVPLFKNGYAIGGVGVVSTTSGWGICPCWAGATPDAGASAVWVSYVTDTAGGALLAEKATPSTRRTPITQKAKRIKTRELKKAERVVDFFFINGFLFFWVQIPVCRALTIPIEEMRAHRGATLILD